MLAIKLHDIYSFLMRNNIDLLSISEKFKLHSQQIVKDVNLLLYNANQSNFKLLFNKIKPEEILEESKDPIIEIIEEQPREEVKEETILFTKFEETILAPIKPMDSFLNELSLQNDSENYSEKIDEFIVVMKNNAELSKENGFEILSGMHSLIYDSLILFKEDNLKADKESIESLRACLIVIAAVVRGKEVDITGYLNKAENFSKKINSIKLKEE
jgi:hypothetical protein